MATCAHDGCGLVVATGWNRCPVHVEILLAVLPFRVLTEAERWELARRVQSKRVEKDRKRSERKRKERMGEFIDAFEIVE